MNIEQSNFKRVRNGVGNEEHVRTKMGPVGGGGGGGIVVAIVIGRKRRRRERSVAVAAAGDELECIVARFSMYVCERLKQNSLTLFFFFKFFFLFLFLSRGFVKSKSNARRR